MSTPADPIDGATEAEHVRIDVLRGAPAEHELAALIAVMTEAYDTEAASAVAEDAPGRSAWAVSQRGLRTPFDREVGWSRFGA